MYSLPKDMFLPPKAFWTTSGTFSLANLAKASAAANFIASLMSVALTSNAPLKMNGKQSTLLTQFGKSDLPVATIQSSLTCLASSGLISGLGLAMANIIGLLFIFFSASGLKAPATETPMKTSAPSRASSKVLFSVLFASSYFHLFILAVLPSKITPLVSHKQQFSFFAP